MTSSLRPAGRPPLTDPSSLLPTWHLGWKEREVSIYRLKCIYTRTHPSLPPRAHFFLPRVESGESDNDISDNLICHSRNLESCVKNDALKNKSTLHTYTRIQARYIYIYISTDRSRDLDRIARDRSLIKLKLIMNPMSTRVWLNMEGRHYHIKAEQAAPYREESISYSVV